MSGFAQTYFEVMNTPDLNFEIVFFEIYKTNQMFKVFGSFSIVTCVRNCRSIMIASLFPGENALLGAV
jgi:hypothetical protein